MCHWHIFFTLRPPQSASPDSSPVKGELYFVGRGLPDAPMHHVILWGATTPARQTTPQGMATTPFWGM